MSAPLIRAAGLTKRYGEKVAVDGLDLEVRAGEVFGLLGPNGAGKTTTILMLLGLTEPTSGVAEVVGLDPVRNPLGVKQVVGYLPDNVGFYGAMTGRQNLRYTARLNGLRGRDAEDRIDGLLEQVGLTGAADRRVDTYSRGMRQRLGIADALVKDPDVVILDEPTIAIDPEGVEEILGIIASLARERGAAVLLSSHLLYQVERSCDRVAIFVEGRMVADGTPAELATAYSGQGAAIDLVVEPGHDPVVVQAVIAGVAGVERVERDAVLPDRFVVTASDDVRSLLTRALVGADVGVVEVRHRRAGLDEVYRRWFEDRGEPRQEVPA